ncbi:Growth-regulating factor [Quillaja saponaria]|uniref:Growth-regulating factor n=1 Tax=Quillaja saponaria TaxID=32244 RepID=A0AAD7L462_QUISA|nr:Growth-regulating factor [Quillaja saponaria]
MSMEVPSDSGCMCCEGEGGGPWKIIDKGMTMMVKDHSQNFNLVIRHGNSCFTEAQRRELELHARIFKHIANGLPVPMYLVLPVWISVANTLPGYGSIDKQLPRCMSISSF